MTCLLLFCEDIESTKAPAVLTAHMQHWKRGSSYMGRAGAGLQIKIKDKIQQLNSTGVSAQSDVKPKLAGSFTPASGEGNRTCSPLPWRPRM